MHYIYLIVNKVNGKTYIGQHRSDNWQDKYMGSGHYLARAKKKYGIKNFEKFLIQYCNSKEEADKAEMFWIAEYRKRGKAEYNIANGGEGGYTGPCSEETRKKLSEALKGRQLSEDHRRKLSEAKKGKPGPWLGKHHSEESKRKMSEVWDYEKRFSEESKQKMSESHKGKVSPRKGAKVSDESKKKMSEAHKGRKLSEETRRKMSEVRKGAHWFTNGIENKRCFECPEGFYKGKTR